MRGVTKVVFRVFLIGNFVGAFPAVSNAALQALNYGGRDPFPWVYIGSLIALLSAVWITIYVLWRKTDGVVRWLAGNIDDHDLVVTTSNADLFRTLLLFLGVTIIIGTIPQMAGLAARDIYARFSDSPFGPSTSERLRGWVVEGVSLLAGIWLVVGRPNLMQPFMRLWKTGSIFPECETEEDEEQEAEGRSAGGNSQLPGSDRQGESEVRKP